MTVIRGVRRLMTFGGGGAAKLQSAAAADNPCYAAGSLCLSAYFICPIAIA